MDNRPIGVFDSGMGGLSVRAEIARALPHESLVYFGDGANVPYGPRPAEEIVAFVDKAVGQLVNDSNVKMLVVACNAATGAALDSLRAKYNFPIIGMEPAVKPAAQTTETGVIGVLATAAAFRGSLYKATAARFRDSVRILETVGEGFVELVEDDRENTPEALDIVRRALEPMLEQGADRIVLGCTHYPFLAEQIRHVIDEWERERGKNACDGRTDINKQNSKDGVIDTRSVIKIVDSAPAIARRAEQLLTENSLHADPENSPRHQFLTFADDDYLRHLARKSTKVPLL
ncbi:MAG: glutamate racemase [Alistipes sp.]|jgi:glutamate racemase|nr:glutamate racemase [Alistipes sp.]